MNLYRLRKIVRYIPNRILAKFLPLKYAKKMGVKIKGTVKFYGVPHLSTEPWLITLGDNVP